MGVFGAFLKKKTEVTSSSCRQLMVRRLVGDVCEVRRGEIM